MSTSFSIDGELIEQEIIQAIWRETQIQMEGHFSAHAPMPKIHGYALGLEPFKKLIEKIRQTPGLRDTTFEEYGAPYVACSAFSVPMSDGWLIVKCKGSSHSLEESLKHEMYHIWENLLKLKIGTLTGKFGV